MKNKLAERFYRHLAFSNRRTAYVYARHVDNFLSYVGKPLDAVTPLDITDWLTYLKEEKEYSDSTIALAVHALRKFFKVSGKFHLVEEVPEVSYEAPTPKWLDEETTFKLIDGVPVLCVAYDLALRIGEVPLLRVETLNLDTGDIEVTRLKHKKHPNKYMLRLDNWCLEIVRDYVKRVKPKDRLFPVSVSTVNRIFNARRRAVGLGDEYNFHCLRHSRITHIAIRELKEKGFVDLTRLAEFAGHLKVETTLRYIHLASKYLAFEGGISRRHLKKST